jgi:Flp pilus assembly protein TadG
VTSRRASLRGSKFSRRRRGCRGFLNAGVSGGSNAWEDSRGAVTAEFAVTLPAVVALLAMLLAGAAAGVTQLRIEEGARAGARALARGEDPAAVERTVKVLAGDTASASVTAEGGWFSITVNDRVAGPLGSSIPWTLTARASTRSETPAASQASGLTEGSGNR